MMMMTTTTTAEAIIENAPKAWRRRLAKWRTALHTNKIDVPACSHTYADSCVVFCMMREISVRDDIMPLLQQQQQQQHDLTTHVHGITFWAERPPDRTCSSVSVRFCDGDACTESWHAFEPRPCHSSTITTTRKRKHGVMKYADDPAVATLHHQLINIDALGDPAASAQCHRDEESGRLVLVWQPFHTVTWQWLVYICECVSLHDVVVHADDDDALRRVVFVLAHDDDDDDDRLKCQPLY